MPVSHGHETALTESCQIGSDQVLDARILQCPLGKGPVSCGDNFGRCAPRSRTSSELVIDESCVKHEEKCSTDGNDNVAVSEDN